MAEFASTSGSAEGQQSFRGQGWSLDELLALGKECLDQCTVEGSSVDLQQTKMLLVNYMSLICEHRNQLGSRPDLQSPVGEFASRFLYVLFHLQDYEECIRWFEIGTGVEDALKAALEASGTAQYDVAISFLNSAHVGMVVESLHPVMFRFRRHLDRCLELQVEDIDSLMVKVRMEVRLDVPTGVRVVMLGRLLLVPGEMYGKLLGTPYSHFSSQQVMHLLDEVLASAIGLKGEGWLVEGEAVLRMGLTFASRIEDGEMRDRFVESFRMELCNNETAYQNVKVPNIDEMDLRNALQANSVGMTNKNSKSGDIRTDLASTSGSAEGQQSFGGQGWSLDELLALGKECLDQCTVEGSSVDLQQTKMLLVNYMSLICEHRNQLGSRPDLQSPVGEFASRFLYVLFHLQDYEECIRWFEIGTGVEDALKAALEASGTAQYDVAISFLNRSLGNAMDEVDQDRLDRGTECLENSVRLQVEDFDKIVFEPKSELGILVGSVVYVKMGNVHLVPGEMYGKLLGTPYSHFPRQQVDDLLGEVVWETTAMRDKDWILESEAVLKMAMTFASRIDDGETRDRFRNCVLTQLDQLYHHSGHYEGAAKVLELLKCSENSSISRENLLRESTRAEACSKAGDHSRAIEIITKACSETWELVAVDDDDEKWKLVAGLKFAQGRILERAGRADEGIMLMEEAKTLCLESGYVGDDDMVNYGIIALLQFYRDADKYIESALSLIDFIDPILSKEECEGNFRQSCMWEKGLLWYRIHDRDEAEKCWTDGEKADPDAEKADPDAEKADPDAENDDNVGKDDKVEELYKKFSQLEWCIQCKRHHLRNPVNHWRACLYLAKCSWKKLEAALEALNAAELVVHRRLSGKPNNSSCLVDVCMLRGSLLFEHRKRYETVEVTVLAYEKAVEILQANMNQDNPEIISRLSICYGMQARVNLESGSLDEGLRFLHKAAPVLEKENPGVYYYLRAMALQSQGHAKEAAKFGLMAFKELIRAQQVEPFETPRAESCWIRTFEESTLSDVLRFNQMNSYYELQCTRDSLIWAERSRTRLFMGKTDGQLSVVHSTSELFDVSFEHAEELLGDAVLMCGLGTAIISYSYCNLRNTLFCYLVFQDEARNMNLHCESVVDVSEILRQLWADGGQSQPVPTLERLVDRVVNAIKATDPLKKSNSIENHRRRSMETAKNLLSILHSVLIKPMFVDSENWKPDPKRLRDRLTNLVFSPQGFLCKVPFGALYDKEQGKYLIQQKTVCVIPSIRTLHRCFQRQAVFEKGYEDLEPPFIAGNPIPMPVRGGKALDQLPYAAQEAENVAKCLDGARLFSGEKMTKAAVLRGLTHSEVVSLSTHGIIDHSHPQGALVLRKSDASPGSSSEEYLTPADIVAMQRIIPAGLVVLSACESGLGKVTQAEGMLGLGRAVLQKGAATTVLTLWKVNDESTRDLITGMFVNLRKGWTVPESLQASMVEMIDNGRPLYGWAPLIAMGSPKLRLPKYSSTPFEFVCTITPDPVNE